MTDETRPEEDTQSEGTGTATVEGEAKSPKLRQTVVMRDTGPCKKHITVTVNREDIDGRLNEKYSELVVESNVAGFRPGKAPRKLVEKRFHK
jgi:trigger factor